MVKKFFCVRKSGNWHSFILVKLKDKIIWADDEQERRKYPTNFWRFSMEKCKKLKEKYGGDIVESHIY